MSNIDSTNFIRAAHSYNLRINSREWKMKSRWADDEEDAAAEAQRKREKEEKKRARAEKQRKLENAERRRQADVATSISLKPPDENGDAVRSPKRRKLSPEPENNTEDTSTTQLLRFASAEWGPCRHVDNYEKLNHIEEGSYGWVSRAKEVATGEVVALKKLKMDNANDGFPVTGLREIQTLMESRHPHIVNLKEVVIGDGFDEYVRHPPLFKEIIMADVGYQRLLGDGLCRARSKDITGRDGRAVSCVGGQDIVITDYFGDGVSP